MATRSTIAIENADGTVHQVYCHWDGFIDYNGKILFEHYRDPVKLKELIDLGDISSLGTEVGVKHPFSPFEDNIDTVEYQRLYGNMTKFYGRDRGEPNTEPKKFWNFEMYRLSHQYEEFEYILRNNGVWYVSRGKADGYQELAPQFEMVDN